MGWYELYKIFVPFHKRRHVDKNDFMGSFLKEIGTHEKFKHSYVTEIADLAFAFPSIPKSVLFRKLTGQAVPKDLQCNFEEDDESLANDKHYLNWRKANFGNEPLPKNSPFSKEEEIFFQEEEKRLKERRKQKGETISSLNPKFIPIRIETELLKEDKNDFQKNFETLDQLRSNKSQLKRARYEKKRQKDIRLIEKAESSMDLDFITSVINKQIQDIFSCKSHSFLIFFSTH